MERRDAISDRYRDIIFGIPFLAGIYLTSYYNYLLFHSLAEIFGVVVSWCIFMVAWNSRRFMDNNYLLFIGIAYLFVGAIDLIHSLAYTGMGVFTGYGTNLPTQLWIAARYVESLSFLFAPLFLGRKLRANFVFAGYAGVFLLLMVSIFYWGIFPECFIEGVGLTPFKKISEYIISVILLGSAGLLIQKRSEFDPSVLRWLVASILVTICSELAFTLYTSAYGHANLIGHILEIISFYLIYKAIIVTGLMDPYNLLFRNLKQSEEALRESEGRYRGLSERLEETVKEKVAELQQAQRLATLGQMVSFVAHEIRNPLQNIRLGVDEIRAEIGEDESKLEILQDIESGIETLNGTVAELLEYSRPVNLEYTPWTVSDIVGQALSAADHKLRNINTRLELQSGDREIYIDAQKIARVLVNIISNAAEAMPNGGILTIHSQFSENEGALKLCVSDSGCGIEEENLERIQEPFFTTKAQGTGLGVPICKKIVEAHGGRLIIRSSVNEGTTVEIVLPAGKP